MTLLFFVLACIIPTEKPPVPVANVCGGLAECAISSDACSSDTAATCCDEDAYFYCMAACLDRACWDMAECEHTCFIWECERSCER